MLILLIVLLLLVTLIVLLFSHTRSKVAITASMNKLLSHFWNCHVYWGRQPSYNIYLVFGTLRMVLETSYSLTVSQGQPKAAESSWATVKAIWRLFSTTFGNVRVDFCQPFSLKVCSEATESYSIRSTFIYAVQRTGTAVFHSVKWQHVTCASWSILCTNAILADCRTE